MISLRTEPTSTRPPIPATQLPVSTPRSLTHDGPVHLRCLSHPLSQREAEELFARHEMAETFARKCA